jgi:hypothetical protein
MAYRSRPHDIITDDHDFCQKKQKTNKQTNKQTNERTNERTCTSQEPDPTARQVLPMATAVGSTCNDPIAIGPTKYVTPSLQEVFC